MLVYVINKHGRPLIPCKPSKARKLLKRGKAKIIKYKPFTIQLLYGSSGYIQPITLGIDTGSKHVGIAAVTDNGKILYQAELELRDDVHSNMIRRQQYRRNRRYRKTRYRKSRFNNRKRPKGWLPPTLRSKKDAVVNAVKGIAKQLPIKKAKIETASFDIQAMKAGHKLPNWLYQKGPLYGEENIKAYVRKRDNYTCQYCGQDLHGKRCEVDHIKPKSRGGTNVPDNMVACCEDCNKSKDNLTLDEWTKLLKIDPTEINKIRLRRIPGIKEQIKKSLIEAAYVQSMKRALVRELNDLYQVEETNGVATKLIRESVNLPKTHYNDAVAIALGEPKEIVPLNVIYLIRQVRKKKRSLHEATPRKGRNKPNKEAKRNRKNIKEIVVNGKRWCLWDKVYIPQKDVIGYITGFTGNYVYIRDMDGCYIQLSSKYKQVNPKEMKLIYRNNNYITESVALSSLQ